MPSNKFPIWVYFLVIIGVGAIFGAFVLSQNKKAPPVDDAQELIKLRVAQTGDFLLYGGLYLADEENYFADEGLEIEISNTGGDEKSVAAVIAGEADIGVGDPTFAGIAKSRGLDVKVFASVVNGVPFWGITYDPNVAAQFESSGLTNLRVATFPAPSTAYTVQKEMFESAGLEPQIVEGAFGSLAGIVERGEAEIALELEPNVSLLQQKSGAILLYSMAERYGDFAITGATVSAEFASENPERVKGFCRALDRAFDFARSNPRDAARTLSVKFPELPLGVVEEAVSRMTAEGVFPVNSSIAPSSWESAIMLRNSVGDIENVEAAMSALDLSLCAS